jgi:hypothetical protein
MWLRKMKLQLSGKTGAIQVHHVGGTGPSLNPTFYGCPPAFHWILINFELSYFFLAPSDANKFSPQGQRYCVSLP